jgi:hypothetical protein
MARFRSHVTYANVIATIALFLALGGGAYAASKLPKNSVTAKQIKSNSITSPKVKDRSLLAKDFKAGQLPAGASGPQGAEGPRGVAGQTGPPGNAAAYPSVLPSGRTEVGVFSAREFATHISDATSTPISFPIPLSAAPTHAAIAPDPSCTGSVTTPTASPGALCIYLGQNVNASEFPTDDQGATYAASRQGAGLQVLSVAGGDTIAQGSWAVTAP